MTPESEQNDLILTLSIDFICAGFSALVLSIMHLYNRHDLVSLTALIPFLWRLRSVGVGKSLFLGMIVAGCYGFVAYAGEMLIDPTTFALKLLALTMFFAVFAATANRAMKYLGLNPVFLAILWPLLEFLSRRHTGFGSGLIFPNTGQSFALGFCSLSGCLLICFAIILVNSLILLVISYKSRRCPSPFVFYPQKKTEIPAEFDTGPLQRHRFYSVDSRAPPTGSTAGLFEPWRLGSV